jgi:hypothetical protein
MSLPNRCGDAQSIRRLICHGTRHQEHGLRGKRYGSQSASSSLGIETCLKLKVTHWLAATTLNVSTSDMISDMMNTHVRPTPMTTIPKPPDLMERSVFRLHTVIALEAHTNARKPELHQHTETLEHTGRRRMPRSVGDEEHAVCQGGDRD